MAETKTVNLNVETNLGSLKSQLRAAQNEVNALADKFGATSDQAVKAAKKAAELKDAIGDAKALTDAFNPDAKFNALSSSLSGVASGFAAYQGALGLAGVESKDLEEQLLKVQSAMAVAQGLQGLGEARDSFKQLKAVAIDAFKGIKTAIGSTGIGLLVVALGALYTYWDDIKELVGGVSEEQKKLNAQVDKQVALENEKLDELNSQDNILKLQGKSEKDILKYKVAQIGAAQLVGKVQIENDEITKKNQVAAAKRNHDYLKTFLDFVTFPQKKLTEFFFTFVNQAISVLNKIPGVDIAAFNVDKILKNFDGVNTKIANLIFDPKETSDKADAVIKEHKKGLQKLENDKAGLLLQIKNIDNEEIKSNKTKNDQIVEDAKVTAAKINEEKLKLQKEQFDKEDEQFKLHQEATYTEQELEIAKLVEQYDKKFELANGNAQLELELEQKQKEELAAINFKYSEEQAKTQAEIDKATKESNKKKTDDEKAVQDQKIQMALTGLSILQDATTLFTAKNEKDARRQFKISKALSLSTAIINTGLAVTAALTAGGNPIKLATGMQFVEAGVAAASGAINIAKISATQFGGFGGGGADKPTTPSDKGMNGGNVITPNFNIVGNNGTNQLKQLQQAPIQAYVVSGEMSTQQSLDRNRLRNATL